MPDMSEAAAALLAQSAALERSPRLAVPARARLAEQAVCCTFRAGELAAAPALELASTSMAAAGSAAR